jgi:hypothetical protein
MVKIIFFKKMRTRKTLKKQKYSNYEKKKKNFMFIMQNMMYILPLPPFPISPVPSIIVTMVDDLILIFWTSTLTVPTVPTAAAATLNKNGQQRNEQHKNKLEQTHFFKKELYSRIGLLRSYENLQSYWTTTK